MDTDYRPERRRQGIRVNLPVAVGAVIVEKQHLVASRVDVLSRAHHGGSLLEQWVHSKRAAGDLDEVNPIVVEILLELDRKLERILNPPATNSDEEEAQTVDLSGYGMLFHATRAYPPDAYVRLAFDLPVFPMPHIELIARVVRSGPRPNDQGRLSFSNAVEFDALREDDRDHIIEFVLQCEREQIRARKAHEAST